MKDTTGAERQQRRRARLAIAREVAFIRPDWGLFLHPDRLPQKAGCPRDQLRAIILKELVDNALDAGATATLAQIDRDTWMVTDDGPGFDRRQVLRLFAVNRPMVSTKLLRRPTRGAIGNGLRVVMGGAVASGGTLQVECRGARYVLDVDRETGDTAVVEENQGDVVVGSRVTVAFGLALPRGADDGGMALQAIRCAGPAARPMLSHPDWYDLLAFAELTHAAEPGPTVARIAAAMGVRLDDDRPASEADLGILKALAGPQPVLLPLGAYCFPGSYAKETTGVKDGLPVPVQVEAWAEAARCAPSRARRTVMPLVNRSPVAARISIESATEGRAAIFGCNLKYALERVSLGASYDIVLAVTSPVIPVTSEGKEPDLQPLWSVIEPALGRAMRKAYRATQHRRRHGDVKRAVCEVIEEAYHQAAGDSGVANARQIYYVARLLVQEILEPGIELKDKYFTGRLLPAFMAEHPQLTRNWDVAWDARGHLIEPHTGISIPVGTLQVRDYLLPRRHRHADLVEIDGSLYPTLGPKNRFHTLLYIEKEGFEPLLRKARVPERFDCALLSCKGNSVTEARRIVDHYARQGVRILVAHDFDRAGTTIAHTLGHSTWRFGFKTDPGVFDLGLRLTEARAMGLQDEAAPEGGAGQGKLREYGLGEEEIDFLIWRGRRVELNAMTSDQFLAWLERKLEEHGAGKVVPECELLARHARRLLARRLAAGRVAALARELEAEAVGATLPEDLAALVERELARDPALPWEDALSHIMAAVTPEAGG